MHRLAAIIPLDLIAETARSRPAEYFADVVLSGRLKDGILHIPLPLYRALQKRYASYPSFQPKSITYAQVVKEIREAPEIDIWPLLKEELRCLESYLDLHTRRSECWKARQKARLIAQYRVAKRKMQAT